MLGRPIEELKLVSCHLGNGSSIAAVGGNQQDLSFGIRSGDNSFFPPDIIGGVIQLHAHIFQALTYHRTDYSFGRAAYGHPLR